MSVQRMSTGSEQPLTLTLAVLDATASHTTRRKRCSAAAGEQWLDRQRGEGDSACADNREEREATMHTRSPTAQHSCDALSGFSLRARIMTMQRA